MNNISTNNKYIIQNNLIHIRKLLGLTQEEFGELIGVTKMTISNYEAFKVKITNRSYEEIRKLVINYKNINSSLSEEELLIAKKLLDKKVIKVNYIKSLEFE